MSTISNQIKDNTNSLKKNVEKKFKKTQLLLANPDEEFKELRESLGWDKNRKSSERELGLLLESKKFLEEAGDNTIIDDDLVDILINNNYYVSTLSSYKGHITNDLLKIINSYVKNNDINLRGSSFNQSNILIIHPFKIKYDENAINTNELIVVEKISDRRFDDKIAYKIIGRTGTCNALKNKFNALFFTHTRQLNSLLYTILFSLTFILGWVLSKVVVPDSNLPFETALLHNFTFTKLLFTGFFITLLFKFFIIPIKFSSSDHDDISLNIFNDKGYSKLPPSFFSSDIFGVELNSSVSINYHMIDAYKFEKKENIKKIIKYNRLNKIFLLLCFFGLFYILQLLPISAYLFFTGNTVESKGVKYIPSTPFTYHTQIINTK